MTAPGSSPTPGSFEPDFQSRCAEVELLVLDVDGVLTDGSILLDADGRETKRFHVRDGSAIVWWRRLGRRVVILSGRRAEAVDHRARELGIDPVLQGISEKGPALTQLLGTLGMGPQQVCYIGDDLADLPVLKMVGLAACPADAAEPLRRVAHLVTRAPGGQGVVREVVERLLEVQGLWDSILARYGAGLGSSDRSGRPTSTGTGNASQTTRPQSSR